MTEPRTGARRRAERYGRHGERVAAIWLILARYRIRAVRVRTPVGEIDLIASRRRQLVFAEVKTRATRAERDRALGAVNRDRIVAAAQWWLAANPGFADWDMRFDVVGLAPFALPLHVRGAFDATPERGRKWL